MYRKYCAKDKKSKIEEVKDVVKMEQIAQQDHLRTKIVELREMSESNMIAFKSQNVQSMRENRLLIQYIFWKIYI